VAIILTDSQIGALIAERKPLPENFLDRAWPKPKRGHRESELAIGGLLGSEFRFIFRMGTLNQLDFSVILAVRLPKVNTVFRLRRYNGRSHEHTNRIERQKFYGFHIHYATERYQALGVDEDAYAEATDRFSDFESAVQCLNDDCGCYFKEGDTTGRLF
jgi:hypothetical protein